MRTIKFNNEANLGAIARRAYRLGGRGGEDKARRAERALLEANPHLERAEGLKRGAIILVPEVPGVRTSQQTRPLAAPEASVLKEVTAAVEELKGTVAEALRRESEDAKTAAKLAGSGKLRNRVKKEAPQLVGRLDDVVENAKATAKEVEERRKRFGQVFEAAQQDLSELKKRFS